MSRKLLLVVIVAASVFAFGQRQVSAGSSARPSTAARGTATPATQNSGFAAQQAQATGMNNPSQTDTGAPASPGVFNNGGWISTYGGVGAEGGVLLATPTAGFASPQPTAGISNAGQAGISNNTMVAAGVEQPANASTMFYNNLPGAYGTTSPAVEAVSAPNAEGGPVNDLGASFYSENLGTLPASGPSVAEVAARYRAQQAQQNIRTYTNADVPHENAGRLGNTFLAANTPPPIPESSAYQNTPAPSSTSQQSQPAANSQPPAQPQPATGEQETQSQTAGSATAPQISQPQSTNQESASSSSLPATSTFLPLLGLLGLVSGGIGIWYRRRHS